MIQLTKKDLYQIQIAMKLDEYMYANFAKKLH